MNYNTWLVLVEGWQLEDIDGQPFEKGEQIKWKVVDFPTQQFLKTKFPLPIATKIIKQINLLSKY